MATGTGKTLLCAALIRRFLGTRNAERVLFIVDRIELAKQTMEDFNVVLREYCPVIFKTARRHPSELLGSSVVVATIQSLIVDRRYRTEFTPFHFDLVINDEAHRSIYGDGAGSRSIFSGYASRSHGHTEGLPEERRYRSPRASRYVQVLWLRTGLSNVPLCVKLLDEADELRKLRALANRRTADLIPALFHEMFGDSVENPGGYEIQQLGAVCNRIIDGTHQPPAFAQKGIPFLFVRNIVSGSIDFNTEKFVTEDTETAI